MASDPLTPRLAAIWAEVAGDIAQVVARFVAELGMFGPVFQASTATIEALSDAVEKWRADGPRSTLRAFVREEAA